MAIYRPDVVIIGGTFFGALLAKYARKYGANTVVVLESTNHIGGLITGGLGISDWITGTRWGLVRQFFEYIAVRPPYNKPAGSEQKDFSSTEAKAAFAALLQDDPNIEFKKKQRIDFVKKNDATKAIEYVRLQNGDIYYSGFFADCSYEVDLARFTPGVKMRAGRDAQAMYNELVLIPDREGLLSLPGHIPGREGTEDFRLHDDNGDRYLNATQPPPKNAKLGDGSPRQQAYGFRYGIIYGNDMPMKSDWIKPPGWSDYDQQCIVDMVNKSGGASGGTFPIGLSAAPVSGTPDVDGPRPSGRYATNGGDLAGIWTNHWGQRSYEEREAVATKAATYTLGANWTVANNPSFSPQKQANIKIWGLPNDEFQDDYLVTPGHPPILYIRDDASIVGQYLMRTHDMFDNGSGKNWYFADSISCGGYNSDFHNFYRYGLADGKSQLDGTLGYANIRRYSIPLRACLPEWDQCSNMVVAWGVSGSAVFRSSFRMEQTAGVVAQALGIYIGLAFSSNRTLKQVPYSELNAALVAEGAVLKIAA